LEDKSGAAGLFDSANAIPAPTTVPGRPHFGCILAIRVAEFAEISHNLSGDVRPTFRAGLTAFSSPARTSSEPTAQVAINRSGLTDACNPHRLQNCHHRIGIPSTGPTVER